MRTEILRALEGIHRSQVNHTNPEIRAMHRSAAKAYREAWELELAREHVRELLAAGVSHRELATEADPDWRDHFTDPRDAVEFYLADADFRKRLWQGVRQLRDDPRDDGDWSFDASLDRKGE